MSNFSKKAGKGDKDSYQSGGEKSEKFVRDLTDNPIFKQFQINNIQEVITDDCIAYYDADTLYFQAASNQENKFITVTHKTEGWSEEFAGVKVFRGLGKGIKKDSWLGMKNLEREVEGKDLYTLDDFEIEAGARLKGDEDYCFDQAKMQVYMKLKRVRNQFNITNVVTVIGSGDNFRHLLPLCRLYKGNRLKMASPILLKKLRSWAVKEGLAEITPESPLLGNIETDDYVDMMGWLGALHYDKTGKYNKICILSDKDGNNSAKLICNPDTYSGEHPKKGQFKFPQPFRVPNTKESAGDIEIIQKTSSADYKFIGFKGLLWQILTVDGADGYSALGHLNGGMGFGEDSAYKLLKPCTTAKEALQATIDKFAELLPYGVQYVDHTGKEHDIDTMEYMNVYFRVVYMLRSLSDTTDFYKICEAFKVDTSLIVGNNRLGVPVRTYVGNETNILDTQKIIESILTEDLKGLKSLKKADAALVIDRIKGKIESIDFEPQYSMVQEEKW